MEDPKSIFEKATPLVVGDVTYQLVFTHKALSMAEQATKMNLLRWLNMLEMSVSDLSGMLLACLNKYHPALKLDDCFEILDKAGVGPVFNAVVTCWKAAQPSEKNGQAVTG